MRRWLATMLVACSSPSEGEVAVRRVEPPSATSVSAIAVEIHGTGFELPFVSSVDDGETAVGSIEVLLGDTPLDDVVWRGDRLIGGTVPAGLPAARYDVSLVLGARTAILPQGYEVLSDQPGPPPAACLDRWIAGPTLTAITPVAAASSAATEADPFVTYDGLTLYFARNSDVYRATRGSTSEPFPTAMLDTTISSPQVDTKITVTEDNLLAFLNTGRAGVGDTDIWIGPRTSVMQDFDFGTGGMEEVNDANSQWDPHISGDGLRLYLAPEMVANGEQHLALATRSSRTAPFGAPQPLSELNALGSTDNDLTLTLDERVVVFASNRDDGSRRLWYAVRQDRGQPFGMPQPIPSTEGFDSAHLSADGCSLYFVQPGTTLGDEIVVAAVQ